MRRTNNKGSSGKMTSRVNELYFERIGDDFSRFLSEYDVYQRVNLILNRLLPKNQSFDSCLEVGCGTGRISEQLIRYVDKLMVSDISSKLVDNVARRLNCLGMQSDVCRLGFNDSEFDLVISSECIEHTPDPIQALNEMKRVLKPNGYLIVTTPNKLWFPVLLLSKFSKVRKFQGNEIWLFPHFVKKWLINNNFRIIKMGGCHLLPWQIPFIKRVLPYFDKFDSLLYPFMINFGFTAKK